MAKVEIREEFGGITLNLQSHIVLLKRHAAVLRPHKGTLAERWGRLYTRHFGKKATLKGEKKQQLLGEWLGLFFEALDTGDLPEHYRKMVDFGHKLEASGITLEEIILSLHFFEEVSLPLLMREYPEKDKLAQVTFALDMLFHNELSCLCLAYFYRYRSEILRLEKMRDDLTHMIVHDLKNPLTVVTIASSSLLEDLKKEGRITRPEYLELIARSGNDMWKMTNNLLDIHKMEEGRFILRKKRGNIEDVIGKIVETNRPRLQSRKLTIEFRRSQLPPFQFDRDVIARVVTNLLDNALKHSPIGGRITVTTSRRNGFAVVSVKDRGAGIAPEDRERIFAKFEQAGLAEKGKVHGTGLGLTFCKMAVEKSGGKIWVAGRPGSGSTFSFSLPLK